MPMRKHQRGMVLVVGLLMLLVITILGVSALSNATLEQRMAANAQHAGITFQAAESAILRTISDGDKLSDALQSTSAINTDYTDLAANLSVSTTLESSGLPGYQPGSSFKLIAYPFEVRGTAEMTTTGAASEHLQAIRRLAPSANNN